MLYIVRYGETDWNKEGRCQGHSNIPLNEQGRNQAREVREKLKDVNFDVVFCSPLDRTIETARIITDGKIITDDRIIERTLGKMDGHDIVQNGFSLYDFYNYYLLYNNNQIIGVKIQCLQSAKFL